MPQDSIREIVYQIRRLTQAEVSYSKELNRRYQVSGPQLYSLLVLYEKGPLSLSQIAKHIMVKPSTVTGIVDRLERKGLAERSRDSVDRRVITIKLTEAGQVLARDAPLPLQSKIVNGLKELQESEVERIVRSLTELTRMLDIHDLEVE